MKNLFNKKFEKVLESLRKATPLLGVGGLLLLLFSCGKTDTPTPAPPVVTITPPVVPVIKTFIPDGWKALTPFEETRFCATAESIGEKIYAGLGYKSPSDFSSVANDWYEYDIANNKWAAKASFPGVARANAVSFAINNKIYVGMGTNYNRNSRENVYTDWYEYDPATDKWTKKQDFPGQGRDQAVFFAIGARGYMGTGNTTPSDASTVVADFWEYDPSTDNWTIKTPIPTTARCRSFGFAAGNKGYLGGGENKNITKLLDFYEYNPTNNTWDNKTNLPVAIARSKGFGFNGNGYITGGLTTTSNNTSETVYKYNTADNSWGKISDIAVENDAKKGRFYQVAATTKTKVYIGLGAMGNSDNLSNQKDFYEYVPK